MGDDAELVERVRRGDRDAFGGLVQRYQQRAFAVAWRFLRQREDAEDVVQDSFLAALQALVEWRRDGGAGLRAVAAQEANLTLAFVERETQRTAIDVKNASGRSLKLDLFVSRDGREFAYAESCPVGPAAGAYAQWPQRIVAVAIANPRQASTETCD